VRDALLHAAGQAWPPFVLVTGLLMIGAVVEADGLFAALGTRIERIGGGPVVLLAALLSLDAVVTAVLNLDTAVVFVTPIIVHAARQRDCDDRPFLYGALFMANGASLLLPGSNLTNLIVLAHSRLSGAAFARAMALPWLAVVVLTIAFLAAVYRPQRVGGTAEPLAPLRLGLGAGGDRGRNGADPRPAQRGAAGARGRSRRGRLAAAAAECRPAGSARPLPRSPWLSARWPGCGTVRPRSSAIWTV
jgi:hypothetical protein